MEPTKEPELSEKNQPEIAAGGEESCDSAAAPASAERAPDPGSRSNVPHPLIMVFSLLMFAGGALVTLMLLARSFNLQGEQMKIFTIAAFSVVSGLAGSVISRSAVENGWLGAIMGVCFGAVVAVVLSPRF